MYRHGYTGRSDRTCKQGLSDAVPRTWNSVEVDLWAVAGQVQGNIGARLFAKAGVVAWTSDVSQALDAAGDLVDDFDDEGLMFGVGVRVNLPGPIDVFGEIEQLTDDFELVHVGVTFGF